jgi:two-component system phosphate regulon sensor histidine kinase PhoR
MPELRKDLEGLDDGLLLLRHSLFTRFFIISFPVLLALGYIIFDLWDKIENGVLLRFGAGILFLYAALLYLVYRVSQTTRRQAELIHEYARTLEEKVRERTCELEESTRREIEAAKEVARLKDEFIFIAAHELRSPVTILKWATDRMKRDHLSSKLPAEFEHSLEIVESSADKLSALIADLLDVARLESYKVTLEKRPVAIGEIIKTAVEGLLPLAEEKKVEVTFSPEEFYALPRVLGDELKLQEVFNNLISNAIKFNRPGGKVSVTSRRNDTFVEVSIKDTGVGIKKADFPRLFTKFFREREEIEGTGLGLWIVKEIMRRLDGDVTVESEEGKGSTFTVKIPIAT